MIYTTEMNQLKIDFDFESPFGLAFNEEHAFVCDSESRCVFKIDIKNDTIIRQIQ